jgi:pseudoazurin
LIWVNAFAPTFPETSASQSHASEHAMTKYALLAAVAVGLLSGAAHAADYEVRAVNMGKGGMMVMEPALLRIEPGDTVHLTVADKGHDFETIPGMLPDGAAPIEGTLNQSLTVTFDKPGAYGLRCRPHYAMGMVALIVVGQPDNEETAKAVVQPGKAKTVFAKLFSQLDEQKTASR